MGQERKNEMDDKGIWRKGEAKAIHELLNRCKGSILMLRKER
jgi:hypothetical protein